MIVFEPNNLQIERQVITIKNLPQSFEGVKIVQLSDFHSYWFGFREKRILEILKDLNPDFIFLTGDFIDPITEFMTDKDLSSVRIFWQEMGKKYQDRIFAVLGNHDPKKVKYYLKEEGIRVLNNENQKIFINNEFIYPVRDFGNKNEGQKKHISNGVYLIGVDDPATGQADLAIAMKGIKNNVPKILLAHGPEIMAQKPDKKGIDLILVGHTHGGQINIPVLTKILRPLKPLSEWGHKYLAGLFEINSTYLYVNRGVGTSLMPIRFNCPPEITLIELRK